MRSHILDIEHITTLQARLRHETFLRGLSPGYYRYVPCLTRLAPVVSESLGYVPELLTDRLPAVLQCTMKAQSQ